MEALEVAILAGWHRRPISPAFGPPAGGKAEACASVGPSMTDTSIRGAGATGSSPGRSPGAALKRLLRAWLSRLRQERDHEASSLSRDLGGLIEEREQEARSRR